MKHRGESGNKGREAARSTAYFVPVHNLLSGIRCCSARTEWSLRGTSSGFGAICGRLALLPDGVTGLPAAKAAVHMKGMWPLDGTLRLQLSRSRPGRLPRPVQRSVDQGIVARKRAPASVSSQARARTSRAASFGRDNFSPVASSAACRRLPTVFR